MPTFSNGDRSLSIAKPTRAEVNQLKAQGFVEVKSTRAEVNQLKAQGFVEVKSTPLAEPKPANPSK